MATDAPVPCPVCETTLCSDDDLEQHLVREHRPTELARQIASRRDASGHRDDV